MIGRIYPKFPDSCDIFQMISPGKYAFCILFWKAAGAERSRYNPQ